MAEYYFKEFEDYLLSLCIQHTMVLHDNVNRRAFVRMQSHEDLQSIPNNAGSILVVMNTFSGRAIGSIEEHKLQQNASILFLVHIGPTNGDPYAAIQSALQKAHDIMFDFYARMKEDQRNDDCGPLRYLVAERMTFFPVDGPVLEAHYGWEMNVPFNVKAPAYNAAKWNLP